MLNQIILVGRIKKIEDVNENQIKVTISVPRPYKNNEGIYENDEIPIQFNSSLSENIKQYCKIDDLIGIKGTIESDNDTIYVNANKVTFLSTTKEDKENGQQD